MTDKYQDLREALSNAEYSDDAYWLDRYRGESGPETIRGLLAERDRLRKALGNAYMALIGYLPSHRNDITDAAISQCEQALAAHRQGGES